MFCDGTDHVITVAIDAITKSVYLYIDGVLSNAYPGVFTGGTPNIVTDFYMGQASAAGQTATVMKTNGIHFLTITGGLPLNISQIARTLASSPLIQLSNGVMSI